jgi:potassium efflux system protein
MTRLWMQVAIAALVFPFYLCAAAEDTKAADAPAPPSVSDLEAQLKQNNENAVLDAGLKKQIGDMTAQALEHLRTFEGNQKKIAEFKDARDRAPEILKELATKLDEDYTPAPPLPVSAPLADFEQRVAEREANLAAAQADRASTEAELSSRAERRRQIPELLLAARQALEEKRRESAPSVADDAVPELKAASQLLQQSGLFAATSSVEVLESELGSFEVRGRILRARADLAAASLARCERDVRDAHELAGRARQRETINLASEARQVLLKAVNAGPSVRQYVEKLALENSALAERQAAVSQDLEKAGAELQQAQDALNTLRTDFETLQSKVSAARNNTVAGLLLRERLAGLPELRAYSDSLARRREQTSRVEIELVDLREERAALADIRSVVEKTTESLSAAITPDQRKSFTRFLRELLESKREHLESLREAYDSLFYRLVDLDHTQRLLIDETNKVKGFIHERIFWVRSAAPIAGEDVTRALSTVSRATGGSAWRSVRNALWSDMTTAPTLYLFGMSLTILLYLFHRRLANRRARLAAIAQWDARAALSRCLESLGDTALSTSIAPFVAGFIAWRIEMGGGVSSEAGEMVITGLWGMAWTLLLTRLVSVVFREHGLAETQLAWPSATVAYIGRHSRRLCWLLPALVFFVAGAEARPYEAGDAALGRLAFAVTGLTTALWMHRLLSPGRWAKAGLERSRYAARFLDWAHKVLVSVPILLVGTALYGYTYTAIQLGWRLSVSAALLLCAIVLHALAVRWLTVAREHFMPGDTAEPTEDGMENTASDTSVHQLVDMQNRRLVRGLIVLLTLLILWPIWVDVLPALNAVGSVALWSSDAAPAAVSAPVPAAPAAAAPVSSSSLPGNGEAGTLTLGNLLFAVLVAVLTVGAVRNVPGFLEVMVLRRMQMAQGERYAITSVARYALGGAGLIGAAFIIGLRWSSIQWLVAALGVGLGFGLQEIFANFISGLIILFERPIRVGDTVTVGGVSGRVENIRMRSTVITDFDRKDLIVPNKEFITTRIINWTRSDDVLRVVIPVGVALDSDVNTVLQLLRRVATENPRVLRNPSPDAFMTGFLHSVYNFELRVFSPSVEDASRLTHELYIGIEKACREAGITISLP